MYQSSLITAPTAHTDDNASLFALSFDFYAYFLPAYMLLFTMALPFAGTVAATVLLAGLVIMLVINAFSNTERALYIYLAWCWLDGTIRGFSGMPGIAVARDIILAIIVIGWLMQRLGNRSEDPIKVPNVTVFVVLFIFSAIIQFFNPMAIGPLTSLGGLKLHIGMIPLLFIAYDVFRKKEQVLNLVIFLVLATTCIDIVSLLQHTQGRDWTFSHYPGTKDVLLINGGRTAMKNITKDAIFRPPGTTTLGGGAGFFSGVIFSLIIALFALPRPRNISSLPKSALSIFIISVISGIFIVTLFISQVRSALVFSVFSTTCYAVIVGGKLREKMLGILSIILLIATVGWSISLSMTMGNTAERFYSLFSNPVDALHKDRISAFEEIGNVIQQSPLGIGMGRTAEIATRVGEVDTSSFAAINSIGFTESYLDKMIFETGLPGAILIFTIAISFIYQGIRKLLTQKDETDRLLTAGFVSICIVIFVNFFFTPILLVVPGGPLFWICGGVILRRH
jgi:hypothetical protein